MAWLLLKPVSGEIPVGDLEAGTLVLNDSTDAGTSNSDKITNLVDLTFDATFPDADVELVYTVKLYCNAVLWGTNTTSGQEPFTMSVTDPPEGENVWTMTYELGAEVSGVATETVTSDYTAPTINTPTGVATGETTATVGITTTSSTGSLRYVLQPGADTAPTKEQIRDGVSHTDGTPVASGSLAPTSSAQTTNLTSLGDNTAYKVHWTQMDVAGNLATVSSSASFTTNAATAIAIANKGSAQSGYSGTLATSVDVPAGKHLVLLVGSNGGPSVGTITFNGIAPDFDYGGGWIWLKSSYYAAGTTVSISIANVGAYNSAFWFTCNGTGVDGTQHYADFDPDGVNVAFQNLTLSTGDMGIAFGIGASSGTWSGWTGGVTVEGTLDNIVYASKLDSYSGVTADFTASAFWISFKLGL